MAKQIKEETPTIVEASISELTTESLSTLKSKATELTIKFKSEGSEMALIGLNHSIEMVESSLKSLISELEKVESIKNLTSK